MQELLIEMRRAMMNEYKRASEEKGKTFVDGHQAYAVVMEEVDEAWDEMEKLGVAIESAWGKIKDDDKDGTCIYLSFAKEYALHAAAESIQVAAMCDKALRSEGVVRDGNGA